MCRERRMPLRSPPEIIHTGRWPRACERPDLLNDCCAALHMNESEAKLLSFYAEQKNGFAPARALIESRTGIRANKVSAVRASLVKLGVIAYGNNTITVDWERIRLFATLDPEQTGWCADKRRKPRVHICPIGAVMDGNGNVIKEEECLNGEPAMKIPELREDLEALYAYWDKLESEKEQKQE